jgi:N-hydroxyarylamine O-acetyltransferase
MRGSLLDAVLEKLAVARPPADLAGLRSLYAAWCASVPFDNTLKLIHMAEPAMGPLPGSASSAFFASWLEHGTGGTCWAGNGALHDLLAGCGFDVERAIATMLPIPDIVGPNHGSVIVTIDGERWIADASILSGAPIRIEAPAHPAAGPLPRFEWLGGKPSVRWRMLSAPTGFPCRIDRIGADREEWDALHRRTAGWSPFNFQLNTRLLRGDDSVGAAGDRQFRIGPDGALETSPLEGEARIRFLVETMGISEQIARRVPPDRPIPPRPPG